MRKLTLSIAAATLATAGVALAAPGMMSPDAKGGDVTRAQAQAAAAEHFAKMDANGDGKLDSADQDAMRAKMFDRIDTDKNGSISREEFAAHHQGRGPDGAGEAGHGMNHGDMSMHQMDGGKRGMRGGHGGVGMARMADANNDGAVSQAEFTAGALKMFDAADADRNGTVTRAERAAARDAMKAKWQANRQQHRAAPAPSN